MVYLILLRRGLRMVRFICISFFLSNGIAIEIYNESFFVSTALLVIEYYTNNDCSGASDQQMIVWEGSGMKH